MLEYFKTSFKSLAIDKVERKEIYGLLQIHSKSKPNPECASKDLFLFIISSKLSPFVKYLEIKQAVEQGTQYQESNSKLDYPFQILLELNSQKLTFIYQIFTNVESKAEKSSS